MSDLSLLQTTDGDLTFLRRQWDGLTGCLAAGGEEKGRLYAVVLSHYSAEGRFYHNLHHVAELLRLLTGFEHRFDDCDAVRFAAWFHDAVYDTKRDDNEERSAELAGRALHELSAPAVTAGRVLEMILATKGHSAEGLPWDAQLFLDADLSILGAAPEVYGQYSEAIREEYARVPEPMFRRGRRDVLEGFLRRERIYHTDEMFARFEERARANLRREIERL
jgi:predicted metal-dependent HD superfamily phosphohydrolase